MRTVRVLPVILSGFLLSSCAIPSAVTSLGYALDGFSYMASGKGVADHALSASQNRDCALLRAVRGAEICDAGAVATGEAGPALAMVETAAGEDPGPAGWLITAGADVQGQVAAGSQDGLIDGYASASMTGDVAEAETAPARTSRTAPHL